MESAEQEFIRKRESMTIKLNLRNFRIGSTGWDYSESIPANVKYDFPGFPAHITFWFLGKFAGRLTLL
jgi:hypothetical protein